MQSWNLFIIRLIFLLMLASTLSLKVCINDSEYISNHNFLFERLDKYEINEDGNLDNNNFNKYRYDSRKEKLGYNKISKLGEGGFGIVYKIVDKDGQGNALKMQCIDKKRMKEKT